jgi:hypothetical protein
VLFLVRPFGLFRKGSEARAEDEPDDYWRLTVGDIHLGSLYRIPEFGTLMIAVVELAGPPVVDETGRVNLDTDLRQRLDQTINGFAALRTIADRDRYFIRGVLPSIGIVGDLGPLGGLEGREVTTSHMNAIQTVSDDFELSPEILAGLSDRLDGVSLLAEALSHSNALGRYAQLLRVFERAFHRGTGKYTVPLRELLAGSPHNFEKREIQRWIDDRPYAIHADKKPTLLLQSDLRPHIPRMTEAAYDVLLNKLNWRSPDSERRDLYKPLRGTSDPDGGLFMTRGAAFSMSLELLDLFGEFSLFAKGNIQVPFGLWAMPRDQVTELREYGVDPSFATRLHRSFTTGDDLVLESPGDLSSEPTD